VANRIEEMEVFLTVADSGGFSAAARELERTPSAISKLILRLENRLGVHLFYRNSRHLKLTEDGHLFYELSRSAIDAINSAEAMVADRARQPTGLIRVRTLLSFAKHQIAPLMQEFSERYPKLRVEFRLGPLPSDVFDERTDLAIWSGTLPDSDLVAKKLTSSRWMLCASPQYLGRFGSPTTPAELVHHNCLGFTFQTSWNNWRFRGESMPFVMPCAGNIAADQGEMLLSLALNGVGIARMAHFHVNEYLENGQLVPLLLNYDIDAPEPIYMVYPAKRNLSIRVRTLISFLDEKFGTLAPWERRTGS
jgi:DNA-binding transcriptional LysR family regulator